LIEVRAPRVQKLACGVVTSERFDRFQQVEQVYDKWIPILRDRRIEARTHNDNPECL
jgi:hypothetical protein